MRSILSHALVVVLTLTLLLLALTLTSCTDDADLGVPAGDDSLPLATTPELLIGNFYQAYGSRDLVAYASLLHPDFVFELASDVDQPRSWDREKELQISERMFCREDHVKNGRTIAGITNIEFLSFVGLGDWVQDPSDEALEILSRNYQVGIRFSRTDGSAIEVRGTCIFRVVGTDIAGRDGRVRSGYQLLGWVDRTG